MIARPHSHTLRSIQSKIAYSAASYNANRLCRQLRFVRWGDKAALAIGVWDETLGSARRWLYAGNTILFALVALRMTALARRDNDSQHLLADSIGLYVLIAASVLAIAISLIEPRGAMLAYLLNLADKPLRQLLVRRLGAG
jgi:hypothetical protein